MSRAVLGAVGVLVFATFARAELVVELVPDDPGPYYGGETLAVDVWLHSEVSEDFRIHILRLAFTDTDPAISLATEMTFDFSALETPNNYYEITPALPVPYIKNGIACECPTAFLLVEAGGSFHVGTLEVEVPGETGVYRLDALDRDEPDPLLGGRVIGTYTTLPDPDWRAFDGEITGGSYDFVVTVRPVPAVSQWGMPVMAGALVVAMVLMIRRRALTLNEHSGSPFVSNALGNEQNLTPRRGAIMSRAVLGAVGVLLFATLARAEVVVELVPDNPGPYSGGETLTVDVWVHSEVDYWASFGHIQFDLTVSDPGLSLDATFTFDYTTLSEPHGYDYGSPALPVPWTYNGWDLACTPACPDVFMAIPPGGSFHVGSIGVQLPAESGEYRLDLVDAEQSYEGLGVLLGLVNSPFWPDPVWRAHTGEITGGTYDFTVRVVPAVSDWGLVVLALLLLTVGTIALTRRRQIRAVHTCAGALPQEARVPSRRSAGPGSLRFVGADHTRLCRRRRRYIPRSR